MNYPAAETAGYLKNKKQKTSRQRPRGIRPVKIELLIGALFTKSRTGSRSYPAHVNSSML